MAKKYNKSRAQKPNYSKRGRDNFRVEAGTEFDLDSKLKEQKDSSQCSSPRQR